MTTAARPGRTDTASPGPSIARKTGEGYDKPNAEQELPLDINYQKLAEWLVARQKLPSDWHKRLHAIQAKVSEAVKELPPGLLAEVAGSADAPVDYFRAVAIRDKLAATGERTLFGGLTGSAGTWDKVVKAYQNGAVYIGEAALTLVQHADYEVPYLRKQMAKCSQQMADAERRHGEYVRSAASCANNYKKECEKLGISGSAAVQQELRQLTQKLPALFDELVSQLRSPDLEPAMTYYQHFTQYAHSSSGSGAAGAKKAGSQGAGQQQQQQQLPDVLPVLTEVRQCRTAAWTPPSTGDAANNAAAAGGGGGAGGGGIDWGSLDLGDATAAPGTGGDAAGGISWDLGDLTASATGGGGGGADGGISWDLGDLTVAAAGGGGDDGDGAADGAEGGSGAPTLNWDLDLGCIDMEGSGQDAAAGGAAAGGGIDWGIDGAGEEGAAGAAAAAGGASRASTSASASDDASAARLQLDPEYRAQLVDDLQELRAFLLSRAAGLSGSSSSADLLRALAPEVVASTDASHVAKMLLPVEAALARLGDEDLRRLLMISTSARYVDRLGGSLARKAGQEAKMLAAAAETLARKQEARATLASLQPKLAEIVARMRTIKSAVEGAVSKQFNGRRVNVLGEINNALASTTA